MAGTAESSRCATAVSLALAWTSSDDPVSMVRLNVFSSWVGTRGPGAPAWCAGPAPAHAAQCAEAIRAEALSAARRSLPTCHEIRRLTTAEAEALEVASRSACRNFGAALRRELVREDSNLRLADPTQQVGAARVTRRSGLGRALTTLIDDSTPERPSTPSVDVQRAVLQHTVDTTPTAKRPSPRPALTPTR